MSKLEKFKKELSKNGYHWSGPNILYKELYQKVVTDSKGKKYFINFKQLARPKEYGISMFFKLDIQLSTNIGEKLMTIDVESNQWFNTDSKKYADSFYPELAEIEKFVERLWVACGSNYYEKYDR